MRVLVCGGRDYHDWAAVHGVLDGLHRKNGITALIHGNAKGADTLAAAWADEAAIPSIAVPADWGAHGKGAGPIRNQLMLDRHKPNVVVAFPGGRGTADMVRRAKKAGVSVMVVTNGQQVDKPSS